MLVVFVFELEWKLRLDIFDFEPDEVVMSLLSLVLCGYIKDCSCYCINLYIDSELCNYFYKLCIRIVKLSCFVFNS